MEDPAGRPHVTGMVMAASVEAVAVPRGQATVQAAVAVLPVQAAFQTLFGTAQVAQGLLAARRSRRREHFQAQAMLAGTVASVAFGQLIG